MPISQSCKMRGGRIPYSTSRWTKSGNQQQPLTWVRSARTMRIEEKSIDHQSVQATLTIHSVWNSRIAPSPTSFSINHLKARPGQRKAFSRTRPPLASASRSRSQSSSGARIHRNFMRMNSCNIRGQLSRHTRHIPRTLTREWSVGELSRRRRIAATTWWTDLKQEMTCPSSSNPSSSSVRNMTTRSISGWGLQHQDLVAKAKPSNQVCSRCFSDSLRPKSKVRGT